MKKLLIGFFLAFSSHLFCQNHFLSVGLKTGVGVSVPLVSKNAQQALNPKPSYALLNGVYLNYKSKSLFQIQTDLLFTRKGYSRKENLFFEDSTSLLQTSTTSFDYFVISIMPGIKTNGKTSFSANLGPQLGFLYNNALYSKLDGNKSITTNHKPGSHLSFSQKIDLSAALEIALNHKFNEKWSFNVGARSTMSIYHQTPLYMYKPAKYFTANIFVGLSYNFGL